MAPYNSFAKKERLCSKIVLDTLFSQGKTFFVFPLKIIVLESDNSPLQSIKAAFSVPKKRFKKAVDRNLTRRRMKEAYRQNKHILHNQTGTKGKTLAFLIIYTAKEIYPYPLIEKGMIQGLKKMASHFCPERE